VGVAHKKATVNYTLFNQP